MTSAREVRELWDDRTPTEQQAARADPEQIRLTDAMSSRTARDADDLARRSGLSAERVRSLLGLLALEGSVEQGPDGWKRTS